MNTEIKKYVISLLENYRMYVQQIRVLRYELSNSKQLDPNEVLGAMVFAKGEGGLPSAGHISDKTYFIAMNYRDKTALINSEGIASIAQELADLEQKIGRLDNCVAQLSEECTSAIRGIYYEGKSIRLLADELHLNERSLRRRRDKAIDELASMYAVLERTGLFHI